MIQWTQYKEYKKLAERYLDGRESCMNAEVELEITKFQMKFIKRDEAIENIINALSDGEHFKPL